MTLAVELLRAQRLFLAPIDWYPHPCFHSHMPKAINFMMHLCLFWVPWLSGRRVLSFRWYTIHARISPRPCLLMSPYPCHIFTRQYLWSSFCRWENWGSDQWWRVWLWPHFFFLSLDIHTCYLPVDTTTCLTMFPQTPAPRRTSGDGKILSFPPSFFPPLPPSLSFFLSPFLLLHSLPPSTSFFYFSFKNYCFNLCVCVFVCACTHVHVCVQVYVYHGICVEVRRQLSKVGSLFICDRISCCFSRSLVHELPSNSLASTSHFTLGALELQVHTATFDSSLL